MGNPFAPEQSSMLERACDIILPVRGKLFTAAAVVSLAIALFLFWANVSPPFSTYSNRNAARVEIGKQDWRFTFDGNYTSIAHFVIVNPPRTSQHHWGGEIISYHYGTFFAPRGNAFEEGFELVVSNGVTLVAALILPLEWLRRWLNRRGEFRQVGFPVKTAPQQPSSPPTDAIP